MTTVDRRSFLSAAVLPALPVFGAEEGGEWKPLFDGRSLAGWSIQEGPESSFYIDDGSVVIHSAASAPTWLRSDREYENFELRGEFFIKGWNDSGICFHAAEHGRPTWTGMQMKVFCYADHEPAPHSCGAIFPLIAPRKISVHEGWNEFRILMDWPSLRIWNNGELVQDLDVESVPELRHRLRRGYFGITTAACPCRFRNFKVRELPSKQQWITLYEKPEDWAKWLVTDGEPDVEIMGGILRADGLGDFGTRETFRDFEFQMYVRGSRQHNGGVQFRCTGSGDKRKVYEIQLHDSEEAHYPTGSLYHIKRSVYPRIEPEKWFLFQLLVKDRHCLVRVNGDTVTEYDALDRLDEGRIELQAHSKNRWLEYKHIRIRRL